MESSSSSQSQQPQDSQAATVEQHQKLLLPSCECGIVVRQQTVIHVMDQAEILGSDIPANGNWQNVTGLAKLQLLFFTCHPVRHICWSCFRALLRLH